MRDEYLSPEEAYYLVKLAQEQEEPLYEETPQEALKRKLRIGAKYTAGLGGGLVIGAGLGAATDAIYKKVTGQPIPKKYLLPIATSLGSLGTQGINYALHKAMLEEMDRAPSRDPKE